MDLFLHTKKNVKMLTKKPLYMLVCFFFIMTSGKSQNVLFRFKDGTTATYPISQLQNFTYGSTAMTVKKTDGTTINYTFSNLLSYRYDGTTPVTDLDVINSAEVRVYPNPFRGAVHISYELLATEQVSVEILDMTGRSIKKWPAEKKKAGTYEVIWQAADTNGKTIQSGTYICRITTSKGEFSKMMVME